jgi:hypothetical protein
MFCENTYSRIINVFEWSKVSYIKIVIFLLPGQFCFLKMGFYFSPNKLWFNNFQHNYFCALDDMDPDINVTKLTKDLGMMEDVLHHSLQNPKFRWYFVVLLTHTALQSLSGDLHTQYMACGVFLNTNFETNVTIFYVCDKFKAGLFIVNNLHLVKYVFIIWGYLCQWNNSIEELINYILWCKSYTKY